MANSPSTPATQNDTEQPEIASDSRQTAATFIDYENLYTFLEEKLSYPHLPADYILEILERLPGHIRENHGVHTAINSAYADFNSYDVKEHNIPQSLYLNGIETRYVPGPTPSSSTGIQLSIDVMETLFHRPDISNFILVTGDRDYLPLIQHLQRYGREVFLVAFEENLSSALLNNKKPGHFLYGRNFLSGESRRHLLAELRSERVGFNSTKKLPHKVDRRTLEIIEEHFGQYEEIYLTPLLRKLSESLDSNGDHDPKSIIGDLEDAGAVRLEKRRGDPHDYTVLIVNPRHPDVVEVREKLRDGGSMYAPEEVSYDIVDYYDADNDEAEQDSD